MTVQPLDVQELMVGSDFICGVVAKDSAGSIVATSSAVAIAEVHLSIGSFSTPGARLQLMEHMQSALDFELRKRGIQRQWTFFSRVGRFCTRIRRLGWTSSDRTLYYREIF